MKFTTNSQKSSRNLNRIITVFLFSGSAYLLEQMGPEIISELGQALLDMGAKMVGLKIGDRGLYLCTANAVVLAKMGRCQVADVVSWSDRELWAPCFATHVVGTTGSGDATIAGFLIGLLRRRFKWHTKLARDGRTHCSRLAAPANCARPCRSWLALG